MASVHVTHQPVVVLYSGSVNWQSQLTELGATVAKDRVVVVALLQWGKSPAWRIVRGTDQQQQQHESRWGEVATEQHLEQAVTYLCQKLEVSHDEDLRWEAETFSLAKSAFWYC